MKQTFRDLGDLGDLSDRSDLKTAQEESPEAAEPRYPLELTGEPLRQAVEQTLGRILDHLESLPDQPAADTLGARELARSLVERHLPAAPTPLPELLDLLFERAIPKSFNTAGPGYLAYIPGGGLPHSAIAELIAATTNRFTGLFAAAPALCQLEANVLHWFAEIVGYPEAARGLLTSGGSLANFTALVTARRERLPEDFLSGTLYASDQAHHSIEKAALLAGFPPARVRAVPTDGACRMRPDRLVELIAADRRRGLTPFFLVGNAGTTNTGAVDPLPELAGLAREHGLWFHVDAAYGGFFLLTDQGRRVLSGIERADSVVLDPHKSLFLPYGTGALLVRDGLALKRAHGIAADYLPPVQEDPDLLDIRDISPELSRPYRGLSVWLPLKMLGITPFRDALDEKLALTRWAADELRVTPGIEILTEPELSLFAFRANPQAVPQTPGAPRAPGLDDDALDRLNHAFLDRINARHRVFLTGTNLSGRFVLRLCILSFRTHRDRVLAAVSDIRAALREVLPLA
ncbi:MAG: aminotransferase class V-fold PLP-dependent enzyme [Acidobacteriota bacterium]|nr:aminotransferase class V-fold PLP-dependent enzyme [Acidobacteriota bacterium]